MKPDFEEKYFFAANSGRGFVGGYCSLIEKAERVFIIKGGPGTGKSSFMRELGQRAEKKGRKTVYYRCSSDPDSLDAILIDGKLLVLDGTSPHAVEPRLPGAKEEIINLGEFWDSAKLVSEKDRIDEISVKKSDSFGVAYAYLSATEKLGRTAELLIAPTILSDKLESVARRRLKSIPSDKQGRVTEIYTASYGMKGAVELDTLERRAGLVIGVKDVFESAHLFLGKLEELAKSGKYSITVAKDPLRPDRATAVYFERAEVLYKINADGHTNINMRRFADADALKSVKADVKKALKLKAECTERALDAMKKASEYHFALEKIYGDAMDFEAKEEFTDNFIEELFEG